ncbi:L-histidine N(alpha)-methyltransferase [Simplicispira psychrophila]|uniref:L-histidine N(alpha)-methyltransferase n=1 Tax=Simplicispira psychrophila TaxID=80882 RepID=UPI0009FEEC1B|nr:L-histidine N(alpha)-methyltransferase [Simplicispira psychrophila]
MSFVHSVSASIPARTWLGSPTATPAQRVELVTALQVRPASIASKYFYDARGSALFEEITRLPEYYPTRTEQHILASHADVLAQQIAPGATVIEWGAGNCDKARQLCAWLAPQFFVALDISADCLRTGVRQLQVACPAVQVRAVVADLTLDLVLPADVPRERRVVFYPGSSIGNYDPPQALQLLQRMRALVGSDGALLLGVDLLKPKRVLEAAYDDAAGVTAAFNRNILRHVNRLIGSDFDEDDWAHKAFFNVDEKRIEMHLQARTEVHVRWPGGGRVFGAGESIHTENSYKYDLHGFTALLEGAGFAQVQAWTDAQNWFAVVLARP